MACTGFPECKYTESLENKTIKTGVFCPSCEQGEIIGKKTKKENYFMVALSGPIAILLYGINQPAKNVHIVEP